MSANIKWRPIKTDGVDLRVGSPSSFIEMMETAFHQMPITLVKEDIPVLRGIGFGSSFGDTKRIMEEIVGAIERHEAVQLFAEF